MFIFGVGKGFASKQHEQVAEEFGIKVVNYTEPACRCGRGCKPATCKESRSHWFAAKSSPYNHTLMQKVTKRMKELQTAAD